MSFDGIAPWYRSLEWIAFGNALQRCRVACLEEIVPPRRALIVGEGNGRFLCEMIRLHPDVEIDCVDASARMLELARTQIEAQTPHHAARVRFLQRDITKWAPPQSHYDLIVTHFVLDCFGEVELALAVKKLAGAATDNASWLIADFAMPSGGFARLRARIWLAVMYLFFRAVTKIPATHLIDPAPFIQTEGFARKQEHDLKNAILKSEMWQKSR